MDGLKSGAGGAGAGSKKKKLGATGGAAGATPKSLSKITERSAALKAELHRGRGSSKARLSGDDDTSHGGTDGESKLRGQVKTLKDDLDRRQSSYIRRERDYRTRIKLLEEELDKMKSNRSQALDAREQMEQVRDMHESILGNIEHVQEQTARILAEQERDLLRAFRARLFDVQTELEKEKTRAQDGASQWIERNRQLEKELDWAKEMADRLDRHNQAYIRENARLKTQFKTQEDDRAYLIRQLVAAKKDNGRLRQELTRVKNELADMQRQAKAMDESGGGFGLLPSTSRSGGAPAATASARLAALKKHPPNPVEENRYKDMIRRLKRLLEVERKNLRQVRTQYAQELQNRTELEIFLHQCIEDVKHDIARRRNQLLAGGTTFPPVGGATESSKTPEEIPLSAFSAADRERVMELLLSQERVISLLYSKTFPPRASTAGRRDSHEVGDDGGLMSKASFVSMGMGGSSSDLHKAGGDHGMDDGHGGGPQTDGGDS